MSARSPRRPALGAPLAFAMGLAACLAGCGSDPEPEARVPGALARASFEGREPERIVRDGENRPVVRLSAGEEIMIRLDGPSPTAGDDLALDYVLDPDWEGEEPTIELGVGSANPTIGPAPGPGSTNWHTVWFQLEEGVTSVRARVTGDVWVTSPRVQRRTTPMPTVVFITSDTHRADHVSCIDPGSPAHTPHIDRLASQGAVFVDCWSSTNVTNPSHIAMMTGTHPRDTKIVGNNMPLHGSATTLAEVFKAEGYQTYAALSAFHLYDELSGLAQGFDRLNTTERFTRDGKQTLKHVDRWLSAADGAPLFLWLHLFDPHTPYRVPDAMERALLEGRPDPRRADAELPLDDEHVPGWLKADRWRDREFITALYAAEVEYLDGLLGEFLAHPRLEGATVVFTSDHGEGLGERDVWWDHAGAYSPMLHVPLVIRGPGVEPGGKTDARVTTLDVGRTLLDMAGLDAVDFPGSDLRVVIDEGLPLEPRFALAANGASASIDTSEWLFEMYLRDDEVETNGKKNAIGTCYLYDLKRDPLCERNVLREHFDRAVALRPVLIDWLDAAQITGMHPYNHQASEEQLAKLRELGYSGGMESVLRWWYPEKRDKDWAKSPWCRAFEGGGDVTVLDELGGAY